jgi:F-type H+-transporting ATPase subunit gamma
MATLRDIRRRIGSVRNTMQITNAMKMVSTAKLSRAQNAVRAAQPYAEQLRFMVTSLAAGLTGEDHPLFARREGGQSVAILFTSDRGLCGAFNAQINKRLLREVQTDPALREARLVIFGRLGNEFFRRRGFPVEKAIVHALPAEKPTRIREVLSDLRERFVKEEVGRVVLAYNHFSSAINQQPRIVPLLPIEPPESPESPESSESSEAGAAARDTRETLFEPSRDAVLDALLPNYLENQCHLAHLNTEAGEHGARMVAMDGATRNAGEMIKRLTLQMNKARQAAITKELIEIVNGAQAL